MDDFPPNSHKARAASEPKKVERVTSAEVRRNGGGLGRKFKKTFFDGDARGAMQAVALAVIVPAIRDMLADAGRDLVDRAVYGESSRARRGGGGSIIGNYAGSYNYNAVSRPTRASQQQTSLSRSSRARHDLGEIIVPHQADANEVIDQMFEIVSQYGSVTMADLFAMVDIRAEHTDQKWGWTDLRGAKPVRHKSGGWILDLPRPEPL